MLIRILRLFPQFRKIEAWALAQGEECKAEEARADDAEQRIAALLVDVANLREANEQLSSEKLLLEDRLESAISDKDKLWATMQASLEGERFAYQTMVNHSVQKSGGGIPYPDAHAIPPESVPRPQTPGPIGRSARILPSELASRSRREFVHSYMETLGEQYKPTS